MVTDQPDRIARTPVLGGSPGLAASREGNVPQLLWIAPRWPLPANDGARKATAALLRGVTALGARVDLVAFTNADDQASADDAREQLGVRHVHTIMRAPRRWHDVARRLVLEPLMPVTVASFAAPELDRIVADTFAENPQTIILHDGMHGARWLLETSVDIGRMQLAYRPHNVERDLWRQAAREAGNPLLALALRLQGLLVARFDRKIAQASAQIFPVSDADAAQFRAMAPAARVTTAPIGLWTADIPADADFPTDGLRLLFVGRLDWEPNRSGLRWFLTEVWTPLLARRPDSRLTIVGSGDGDWLKAFEALPNVDIAGRVDRVEPYYEACTACIVPVFFGSGTRVKVIEASLLARACISTAIGVEGVGLTPGTHYIHAETAGEWLDALTDLSPATGRQIGRAARNAVVTRFDARSVAAGVLNGLTHGQAGSASR